MVSPYGIQPLRRCKQLVELLPESGGDKLRLVMLSGDWIPLSLPDAMKAVFPNVRVAGFGGATEAAIWSNFHNVQTIQPEWKSIPYGRPIQNARYYVLGNQLHGSPTGVTGDLFIAGDCLSVGYYNQPALTAVSYIPDPFADQPGSVMYRTGDRARFMDHGEIEFMGRLDGQVKVRGYRIELSEIDAAP